MFSISLWEQKQKKMTNAKNTRKASNKVMKAVYAVHMAVNFLNEFGVYNMELARRKAASYNYWITKK